MPKTIELSDEAYAAVCGLVQPSGAVNQDGIFTASWEELRLKFPLADFRAAVKGGVIEYNEEAGL